MMDGDSLCARLNSALQQEAPANHAQQWDQEERCSKEQK
jgi:hypothetical protein